MARHANIKKILGKEALTKQEKRALCGELRLLDRQINKARHDESVIKRMLDKSSLLTGN